MNAPEGQPVPTAEIEPYVELLLIARYYPVPMNPTGLVWLRCPEVGAARATQFLYVGSRN